MPPSPVVTARAAFEPVDASHWQATELTRGPWDPQHQHAGPPIALACRAIEAAAAPHGLTHVARLTANLLRPVPLAVLEVTVTPDYVGRNAGHFAAEVRAEGKVLIRLTALVQREQALDLPADLPGHPLPAPPRPPEACAIGHFPFERALPGYSDLVQCRPVTGRMWQGPSMVWFRMNFPLVAGETPSPYQRVAVAADSGNGISGILDVRRFSFVNSDLTINLLRRPEGEWIALDARTLLGEGGGGLAESALHDGRGLIGRGTQSLAVRAR